MNTRSKVALAVTAAVLGGVGGLASMDCYQGTVYEAGQYRHAAECVPRGQKWKPKGAVVVSQEERFLPGAAGGLECACTTGTTCEARSTIPGEKPKWAPAPPGLTLASGQWRGAGCLPKTCVELAGKSSWPKECKP